MEYLWEMDYKEEVKSEFLWWRAFERKLNAFRA